MHEHESCSHDLKFCKHCNVVYCEKCKLEWKQETGQRLDWWYKWPISGTSVQYPSLTTGQFSVHASHQ